MNETLYRCFGQNGHEWLVVGTVAFAEVVQSRFDDMGAEVWWVWYWVQLPEGRNII